MDRVRRRLIPALLALITAVVLTSSPLPAFADQGNGAEADVFPGRPGIRRCQGGCGW
ncbi:MAG: hypothetical protein HC828_03550 [Blastochloris sp.]|nr:hypothetical protein [Blastochloris sp.]